MVHELGHVHMLQHSVNPEINTSDPEDNYLMFYTQTGFDELDEATIKTNDEIGANMVFTNSIEILDGSNCATPISTGGCVGTNSIEDLLSSSLITITPNPNNGNFTITFTDEFTDNVEWTIQDIVGRQLASGNSNLNNHQISIQSNTVTSGTYILTLFTKQGLLAKKMLIHD